MCKVIRRAEFKVTTPVNAGWLVFFFRKRHTRFAVLKALKNISSISVLTSSSVSEWASNPSITSSTVSSDS